MNDIYRKQVEELVKSKNECGSLFLVETLVAITNKIKNKRDLLNDLKQRRLFLEISCMASNLNISDLEDLDFEL